MAELHVVYGVNGPVGESLVQQLRDHGHQVRGVCRSGTASVPAGVEVAAGDAKDVNSVIDLCRGAAAIYCCIGLPYNEWASEFPPAIDGLIEGAADSAAALVFADNLYCYGPVKGPLREDLPHTNYGEKPALRAKLANKILEAHRSGRINAVIVRASDFYGPGVTNAMLGKRCIGANVRGKKAQIMGDPDQPHSYTYVPDFARALVTVAGDSTAWGQAWHVPNAPTVSTRRVLEILSRITGNAPDVSALPVWVANLLGHFSPLMAEFEELQYQFTQPFVVDHSKFAGKYWSDATSFEDGLAAAAAWYQNNP